MTQIIDLDGYCPFPDPSYVLPLINREHRGASMLIEMCSEPSRIFSRAELMSIGHFNSMMCGGPVCAVTAFHWWILRINDRLPRTSWRINENSGFRLSRISAEQEDRLIERLGLAA